MARICVVRQLYYPRDEKVRREIDALLDAGHEVDLFCMRDRGELSSERRDALTVRRLPLTHRRGKVPRYLAEYAAFLVLVTVAIGIYHFKRRYALVQVNTPPDSLVLSSIVPRLFGAKVLLQLSEPMPEFFATKFGLRPSHPAVRLVAAVEQLSLRYADLAIACTEQMRTACIARGARPEKIIVVTVASDESVFDVTRYPGRPRDPARFVLISHGTIEERYGLDTAVRAVSLLRDSIPGLRLKIVGSGSYRESVQALATNLGVSDDVEFSQGWVPTHDLLTAIADADVGLVAMKRDAFRDLTHNLKMYDFIAMRKPAIVSRTRSVDEYFDDNCFRKFNADDAADLARAISDLHKDPALAERLVARATVVNEPYRWHRQRQIYLDAVAQLLRRAGRRRAATQAILSDPHRRRGLAIRANGTRELTARAKTVALRFGMGSGRMASALEVYVNTTEAFDVRPTLPITASVLARHPALVQGLAARGVEFAVHGLFHNDYSQMPAKEQRESISGAMRHFAKIGVPFTGFRGPYLRANNATDVALRELGFAYNSSKPVRFFVLDAESRDRAAYRRAIDYYSPADARALAVRPRDDHGLIQIPVALPDDEMLIDRLRLSPQAIAAAWRAVLHRTHERGELFTLQLHPERICSSVELLRGILTEARALTPDVWIPTLHEIAAWWARRLKFSLRVEDAGPHEHAVHFEADPDAVLLVRGPVDVPSVRWYGDERIIDARCFRIRAERRPVVALSPRTPENVAAFLREEGYPIQWSDERDLWGAFVDVATPDWRETDVLATIEAGPGPVLRISRWPSRARSALAITGDVDSVTLFDFASRMVGR